MLSASPTRPTASFQHLWRSHAPLTVFTLVLALLGAFFFMGIFMDSRVITGAPAWVKPTKFVVSFALYALTITWLLGFVRRTSWLKRAFVAFVGWSVVFAFTVEVAGLVLQTVRGVTSHFNYATPFDNLVISTMAMAIFLLWGVNLVLAFVLLFERFESPALAWGVRLGMIIALVGMMQGMFMIGNTSASQLERMEAGEPITILGAHSVGVEDGGAGLPGLYWSTEGGDLRVAHFVGMHALQVLPLLALFLIRRRNLRPLQASLLVWIGSAVYLGLVVLTTWQALRGQAITAPDALTVSVFATIVGVGVLASLATVRLWRPRPFVASVAPSGSR